MKAGLRSRSRGSSAGRTTSNSAIRRGLTPSGRAGVSPVLRQAEKAFNHRHMLLARTLLRGALLLGSAASAVPLLAQTPPATAGAPLPQVSHPVVQAVPEPAPGMKLNAALGRLAHNAQDVDALIEAGRASLQLGDVQAAIGFFKRADTLSPANPRIKAGLGGAYVQAEDPFSAIDQFDAAEKLGPIAPELLADRGLAFDLVGDNRTAQDFYRQSLAAAPSDETLRRLALSQAIGGDLKAMELSLAPLLQKGDHAASRTRIFGLAILGKTEVAEAIARATMPADMATAITGYLRYMPRLTRAQQASAASLGHFPRASEIGTDDPRLAQYVRSHVQIAAAAPAARPVPAPVKGKGKPAAAIPVPAPAPAPILAQSRPVPPPQPQVSREELPPAATTPPASAPRPAATLAQADPVRPAPAPSPAPPPAAAATPGFTMAGTSPATPPIGFDLAQNPASSRPAPSVPAPALAPPAAKPAPAPAAPRRQTLDDVFADFSPPSREVEVKSGAVDLRRLKPVVPPAEAVDTKGKGKGGKDAKAPPSQPSRIWVQIATGRDKAAFAHDWKKRIKDDPEVFKGRKPSISAYGQSKRLLVGPFETDKEANAFLARLKKAGIAGGFVWTSPAGQVVEPLAVAK